MICFPQACINQHGAIAGGLRGSVHALAVFYHNTHCHYRIKQTWESASGHFAMQMLQWEKSVSVSVTVTLIYTTPQRQRVLSEAYFKHSPGLSVHALVMSAYLLVFLTLLLICLPQESQRMTIPTKQHIYILMCIDVIHLISHMAQENKYTSVIPHRVQ